MVNNWEAAHRILTTIIATTATTTSIRINITSGTDTTAATLLVSDTLTANGEVGH